MDRSEYTLNETIVCPWCDASLVGPYTDGWAPSDEKRENFYLMKCHICRKEFGVQVRIWNKYSTRRKPCEHYHEHRLVLAPILWQSNPYNHEGRTWTLYECTVCHAELILTDDYPSFVPHVILPTMKDFHWLCQVKDY